MHAETMAVEAIKRTSWSRVTFPRWPSRSMTFRSVYHCPLNVDDLITLQLDDEPVNCLLNGTSPRNFPETSVKTETSG